MGQSRRTDDVNNFQKNGHHVFRAASPLSQGMLKSKVAENYQYSSAQMREGLKLFRPIISVHYLSIYGAVSQWSEQFDLNHSEKELDSEEIAEKGETVDKEAFNSVYKDTEKYEFTRSELFGENTKESTCAWQRIAGKYGKFDLRSRINLIAFCL